MYFPIPQHLQLEKNFREDCIPDKKIKEKSPNLSPSRAVIKKSVFFLIKNCQTVLIVHKFHKNVRYKEVYHAFLKFQN